MQKISCHCTLYLRLVYDMLCPFLWNVDHRHAPSIYNQDTNRLWFLWDCYFRQLLYISGSVLLENSGDKKSCKEHSKRVRWGTEWIIPPLLEAKMISSMPIWGSKGGDGYGKQCWLTIENTPFQCDAGSNPGVDHILGLSLFLVLSFALRGFSPGAQVFSSPQNQFFQSSIRSVEHRHV